MHVAQLGFNSCVTDKRNNSSSGFLLLGHLVMFERVSVFRQWLGVTAQSFNFFEGRVFFLYMYIKQFGFYVCWSPVLHL